MTSKLRTDRSHAGGGKVAEEPAELALALSEVAAPRAAERMSGTAEWLSPVPQSAPEPAWKITVARAPAPEPLRPADFQLAEAFIDLMSQKLEAAGVAVQMETDFREFVKLRSGA